MTTTHTTVGGSSSAQDMQISWEPESADLFLGMKVVFVADDVTSLTLSMDAINQTSSVDSMDNLVTLSFPNLLSIDEAGTYEGFSIVDCSALTSISFPKLEIIGSTLEINGSPTISSIDLSALESANGLYIEGAAITSLDLSALVTIGGSNIGIASCSALESINLSAFVPTSGGEFGFAGNALTAASVNAILARFVANAAFIAGTIDLSGGTNAAPTGQGLTDVTTLRARGVTVIVSGE